MNERDGKDRARALMMAALDGEISPADREELDLLIARTPEIESEWRRMRRVKEVTSGMALQNPPEEVWDRYWVSVYRRTERGIAWALVSAGVVVLAAYGLWHAAESLLADTGLPGYVKVAIVGVAIGTAILIVSVVREKLFTSRRDPYEREILR